ncbi:hypothetical protein Cgig2_026680 [Carnegiea gigantea]|uniref:Uncharacterized protein n=1 Tax=Carnegiea gigantea TaxID=171969 RepID=A0A9Q1JYY2_9CARY|nr:hypothetical protein Cgig2_026680 [Carnegiea gigantea]
MGSERKSKERSRKRASDSQSEDGGEPKRHRRSSNECAEGSIERDKKEKSHHKRDAKKVNWALPLDTIEGKHKEVMESKVIEGKGRKEEKKSQKEDKSKHSKHDRHSKPKFKELSEDDYFSKNNEFATWLKEKKNKFFSDLSSESARELFSEFVEVWNSKKLKSKYYKGIETGPRSSHKWKIKN